MIDNKVWVRIYEYLKGFSKVHTDNEYKCRKFVEGVFWIVRSGAQ